MPAASPQHFRNSPTMKKRWLLFLIIVSLGISIGCLDGKEERELTFEDRSIEAVLDGKAFTPKKTTYTVDLRSGESVVVTETGPLDALTWYYTEMIYCDMNDGVVCSGSPASGLPGMTDVSPSGFEYDARGTFSDGQVISTTGLFERISEGHYLRDAKITIETSGLGLPEMPRRFFTSNVSNSSTMSLSKAF